MNNEREFLPAQTIEKEGKHVERVFIELFNRLINPSEMRIWHASKEDDCKGGIDWWIEARSLQGCVGVQVSTNEALLREKLETFCNVKIRYWMTRQRDLTIVAERGKTIPFYFWIDPIAFEKWEHGDLDAGKRLTRGFINSLNRQLREVPKAGGVPLKIKIESISRHIRV